MVHDESNRTNEPQADAAETEVSAAGAAGANAAGAGADETAARDAAGAESPTPPPPARTESFADDDDDFVHVSEEDEREHAEFTEDDLGEEPFVPHTERETVEAKAEKFKDVAPLELDVEEVHAPTDEEMDWYILKVQSNRETSIASALERRVKMAGLEPYFDKIMVPVEKVTEFKGGKKKVVKKKKYPGYIVVRMAVNDESWFLVRETAGIGDFTGSIGRPSPMLPNEVAQIVEKPETPGVEETPRLAIPFNLGDRVKINEGTFENFEGDVDSIDTTNGRVIVMINIFGRSTPVELEYWQIENI